MNSSARFTNAGTDAACPTKTGADNASANRSISKCSMCPATLSFERAISSNADDLVSARNCCNHALSGGLSIATRGNMGIAVSPNEASNAFASIRRTNCSQSSDKRASEGWPGTHSTAVFGATPSVVSSVRTSAWPLRQNINR